MTSKLKKIYSAYTKPLPIGEEWYEKRMEACITCPLNVINMDKVNTLDKIIKNTLDGGSKGVCSICHCPVEKKAAVKEEYCALKLKGETPKWEQISIENVKGTNLSFEINGANFSIQEENNKTLVKCTTSSDNEEMDLFFKGYQLKTATPSCGCMVLRASKEEENLYKINVKTDTTAFAKNQITKRSIETEYFYNGRTKNYSIHFEFLKV